ncbi:PHD-finger and DNA binding domain-containing protein [Striga asiatica]|uniref:PHD-finger and DNA binding domain-containing protein n=1 Tax=Striga asiatica TaxID=4170 RepID=A0A5A7Q684_STRAF|nr:PHD-finger and DNA binding domain-containing protein [Striga asiatica]
MEYVGRRVKKESQGHGTSFGSVQSYEPSTEVFKIVYDGGDSEELELAEVSSLLLSTEPPPPPPPPSEAPVRKRGRPKKRRRIVNKGTDKGDPEIESVVNENMFGREAGSGGFDLNSNEGMGLDVDAFNLISRDDHGVNGVGAGGDMRGLDLNEVVNFESNEQLCLNNGGVVGNSGETREIIDLNLDAYEDCEKLTDGRKGRCFDLNLQLTEDEVRNLEERELQKGANETILNKGNMQLSEVLVEHDTKEYPVNVDDGNRVVNTENKEDSPRRNSASGLDNGNVATQKMKRGRKRKDTTINNIEVSSLEPRNGDMKSELDSVEGTRSRMGDDSVDHENGVLGTLTRGRRGRKRRDLSENNVTLPTPSTGLRRSSRRAKREALSDSDQVPNVSDLGDIDQKLSSPAINFISQEKKIVKSRRKSSHPDILPPKLELPPSSCNLDLDGVPLFDLVSVYAFLRSFSILLFLSPFELVDFVASVKCNDSTLLFDSVHVSLLRTLRKHLESLSNEGSVSAADCLRSLNWDLLDLITWPMFAVEYLLLHSPGYIPGLDRCHLKILLNDYYKLPVSAKVEILRHLCDDVIEVEVFRSELNRRISATEYQTDLNRDSKFESSRKRKPAMDAATTSCVMEEDAEESADGNSDECCLCKMDGNLICCDGCPAAFHSRCVGVVSRLLPEGDWYCPECAIEKDKPCVKVGKSIRGAELLGSDVYGRIFYSSCGYLLVLESCNEEYSFCCYDRNDLPGLIEVLESAPFVYDSIISAICERWNVIRGVDGAKNDFDLRSCSVQSTLPGKGQLQHINMAPSEILNKDVSFAEKMSDKKSIACTGITNSSNTELDIADSGVVMLETGDNGLKMENNVASSEGSNEVSQTFPKTVTLKENGPPDSSVRGPESVNDCPIPGKIGGDHHMTLTSVNVEKDNNLGSENQSFAPDSINFGVLSPAHCPMNYDNCYELARIASSYYEEFTSKSSDKTSGAPQKTVEEFIAGQAKVVSNRYADFSWSNIQNRNVKFRKERCGWCFFCRYPDDERDCLFIMNDVIPAVENFTCEVLGIQSGKNRKNHLLDIMCHIICLEDHLKGLLLGPWLNPHYSMLWRKSVLGVVDLASLKKLLLKLESNVHHLAIYADWRKHVDSVITMGSASHIISSSARASSKYGTGKKKAKSSEVGTAPSSNAATGLSLFWWRGGKGSRMLFSWKVLPNALVSKAARQGGGKKIPGVLYPEIGEYAKRTKSASWRAAVETSTSVEQLALQACLFCLFHIRELDANIRWEDIGNSSLISKIDKDTKKPVRSFKKVIVRRKCSEGSVVKYLLDFGKRRFIPEVVMKHGTMLEDSSNEKKRYWLEESHMPLHLLKSFEEKRVTRKSNKVNSGKHHESTGIMRKSVKKKGFEYLFSRSERSENYQCGHCKKDVPIREAVSCQRCEGKHLSSLRLFFAGLGFFHKRHVRKSVGFTICAFTYTCHKCQGGQSVKVDAKKGKSQSPKLKNASTGLKPLRPRKGKKMRKVKRKVMSKNRKGVPLVEPLRRSARNAERVAKLPLQSTRVKKRKKRKQAKTEKGLSKKPKFSSRKKKRTPVNSSYWLNGLQLSHRPNDERLMHFRSRMLLVLPGEVTSVLHKPKCTLCCELEHKSDVGYVACEICGVWFHVDALNPRAGEIENVIGFKCHLCLNKRPPLCPHPCPIENDKDELISEKKTNTECTKENSNCSAKLSDKSACRKSHYSESKDECMAVNFEKQPSETT